MPHSEKVDVFELTDCQYEPEYLYFTEIDDMLDGRQTFNIIKYNITDHTHTKIISLKDNMNCILTGSRLRFLFWMTLI